MHREDLYRACLETVAPAENHRMRLACGMRNNPEIWEDLITQEMADRETFTTSDVADALMACDETIRRVLSRMAREGRAEVAEVQDCGSYKLKFWRLTCA